MSVINDDSLFYRANTRKVLRNLGLYGVLKQRCRRDSWLLTCINEWCDWPGKSDGEALQQSCRAALGNLIGDPLVEFPINFQPQFAIQKGALVAHHCMPRQGLERFQHGSSIPKAHSFSRDGWSSFTRHQNPS